MATSPFDTRQDCMLVQPIIPCCSSAAALPQPGLPWLGAWQAVQLYAMPTALTARFALCWGSAAANYSTDTRVELSSKYVKLQCCPMNVCMQMLVIR